MTMHCTCLEGIEPRGKILGLDSASNTVIVLQREPLGRDYSNTKQLSNKCLLSIGGDGTRRDSGSNVVPDRIGCSNRA